MSEKFKVGDKVIAKPKNDYGITTNGWQGVVTETAENWFSAKGKDTLGRDYVFTRLMYSGFDLAKERIEQEKIVIVTDGRNTTAMMYKDGKKVRTSMSKCSPDDKFDFATGARIAFERLIGDSEKEPEKDLRGLLIDGVFGKSDKYECNENEIEEAYQKGMNEIWAFVGEIECLISAEDLEEIFGKDVYNCYNGTTKDIIEAYTATEALEKFENWRKERLSIKLGDVVKSRGGTVGIVVDVKDSDLFKYTVLYPNEFMIREYNPSELTKTGKHCDGIEDFKKLMTNLAVDLIKGEV